MMSLAKEKKMFSLKRTLGVALICAVLPVAGHAEENLGAIIDQGAKKLTVEQLRGLIVGRSIHVSVANKQFTFLPKENGDLPGNVSIMTVHGDGHGTWKTTDDGRLCLKLDYSTVKFSGTFDHCSFWFQLGDKYWVSSSDADKAAPVFSYDVSK